MTDGQLEMVSPELLTTFHCECGRAYQEILCLLPGERVRKRCVCGRWMIPEGEVNYEWREDDQHDRRMD